MLVVIQEKMKKVVETLRSGGVVLVTDDENRENEGDLVACASTVTYDYLNFISKEARGLMCVPITQEIATHLNLSQMVQENSDLHQTAFTVSVDAKENTTTGISISDRLTTLRTLSNPKTEAQELNRPGHLFPLTAKRGGLFERQGHTEATIELLKIADLYPVGLICEVMQEDGKMARKEALSSFSNRWKIPWISIQDILFYLKIQKDFVHREVQVSIPTDFGTFEMIGYHNKEDQKEHFALVKGDPSAFKGKTPLVRVHSECLTGDLFASHRCDCGSQLHLAMRMIEEKGEGVILYLRQEGRDIGLFNKLKAYQLQDQGYDTVEANLKLGFSEDDRDYGIAAAILHDLNIDKIELLSNNPKKIEGLEKYGISVVKRTPCLGTIQQSNQFYLQTKKEKMGHLL